MEGVGGTGAQAFSTFPPSLVDRVEQEPSVGGRVSGGSVGGRVSGGRVSGGSEEGG